MKVGNIEAKLGEHAFGYLEVAKSRSGLGPDIPVHVFAGSEPGPTLLVQGAIHGGEIIGSVAILNFIEKLKSKEFHGTVIAVPVVNRIGFELGERGIRIANSDISRLFPGSSTGSVPAQIAHVYFEEIIKRADVMIDFHAGARTAYERYVLFGGEKDSSNPSELELKRRKIVVAFGLDKAAYVALDTFGTNTQRELLHEVVCQITLEFGGGTGWYKNGKDNISDAERGIWNIMKSMRMIEGEFESDEPLCTVYNAGIVIWKADVDGLFIRNKHFGEEMKKGDVYAVLVDAYTGEEIASMTAPEDGVVIPSGQEWPTIGATSVGVLGNIDRVEDRRTANLYVDFD